MKYAHLLPLALVSTFSHATLVKDADALESCLDRFDEINQTMDLSLRSGPIYRSDAHRGEYRFYFNTKGKEKSFRVECHAKRIGKVIEFNMDPGRWIYRNAPVALTTAEQD